MRRAQITDLAAFTEQVRAELARSGDQATEDPGGPGEVHRERLERVLAAAEAVLAARQVLDLTEDALCDAIAELDPSGDLRPPCREHGATAG